MKVMLSAFLAIGIIAIAASLALKEAGFSSSDRQTGEAVRLD